MPSDHETLPTASPSAIDWLHVEFSVRRARNPHYSLRAYARSLRLSPGPLSEILASKRRLTLRLGRHLADRLLLCTEDRERFLRLVGRELGEEPTPVASEYQQLAADAFHLISDWYHFAILSLMETRGFRSEPAWIARRLGISSVEVRQALARMRRLELVERRRGKWKATGIRYSADPGVPSGAVRKFHRQVLERALAALDEAPFEAHDVSSMTLAIDPDRIPAAKARIRKFRRRLARYLEGGNQREVYQLNIQLIPVTQKEKL